MVKRLSFAAVLFLLLSGLLCALDGEYPVRFRRSRSLSFSSGFSIFNSKANSFTNEDGVFLPIRLSYLASIRASKDRLLTGIDGGFIVNSAARDRTLFSSGISFQAPLELRLYKGPFELRPYVAAGVGAGAVFERKEIDEERSVFREGFFFGAFSTGIKFALVVDRFYYFSIEPHLGFYPGFSKRPFFGLKFSAGIGEFGKQY